MSNGSYSQMLRVSRQRPCLVCGKHDWCLVAADGTAAICPRVEEGSKKRVGDAGWLHILADDATSRAFKPTATSCHSRKRAVRDWSTRLAHWQRSCGHELEELAGQLGVSPESLDQIGSGYDVIHKLCVFPERNSDGTVIGIQSRDRQGVKKRLSGSHSGLYIPKDWEQRLGPILLVEGATDTAAVLTMGLCGVGRPSNTGGVDHLIGLLESVLLDREIVVIGERDQKPNGNWPGRDGAVSTASQLAESLQRPIAWSLPPDDSKDTRAWLKSAPRELPIERLADLYLSGLSMNWVHPIPVRSTPKPAGPTVPLSVWRDQMLAIRLASLAAPGCYLDASPTGSGKSFVDLQTLLLSCQQRIA